MIRYKRKRSFKLPPPAFLSVLYFTLIIIGMVLLKLPFSTTHPITLMEAFFTSTSAVTVTGLVLVDTGTTFTVFGQIVIMILIQLGGLGLMTFAALLLLSLGISIGMPQQVMLREDLNQTSINNLRTLVQAIVKIALICETVGVIILATVFVPDFGWSRGLWHSLFHTVSAFNNAGFALWPDSLSAWVGNPVINLAIPAMFIIGGLGFIVIGDIAQKRQWQTLTLHTKLMLVGTLAFTAWGFLGFAFLEWNNPGTLGALANPWDKLLASWFQSVTTRTAGFNTVEIGEIHDSSTLLMISLMLVGGGSTSTAGGIKVTTVIVLLLATIAFFKRNSTLHAFGRSIGLDQVLKVLALTTVSVLTVMTALFLISISHDGNFVDLSFEVASAFGTVGLTRGATTELDTLGRVIVLFLMFLGRVGPLTLGFFLASHSKPRVRYPAGQVYLG
ncbi:TrkH family potassium uptake protein [Qingshengfaniella alkalisoli]|uniref:Ktr system potassium transporter B n=1 Tax=Qingshengfaniella alkalisoli TaxID=2599296 RepID=A0A5B8IU39_9RHOB|nr:TrkH family potassium uptake protein [Qingshengfaniella alkalisoli]QDY68361.1 Ktr system potassium transporter B [Qingshengfaniella alkalisoli]